MENKIEKSELERKAYLKRLKDLHQIKKLEKEIMEYTFFAEYYEYQLSELRLKVKMMQADLEQKENDVVGNIQPLNPDSETKQN